MSDYVSKEELKKFFEDITITVSGRTAAEAIGEVFKAIYNGAMKLPTTDAEPVRHGKWIPYKAYLGKHKDSWVDEVRCSVCGYAFGEPEWKYCPECGADMRGDNSEHE